MKTKTLWQLATILFIVTLIVTACAEPTKVPPTAVPPTKAPEATKAPVPTTAPVATKAPEPTKAPTVAPTKAPEPVTFGMLFVGPYNDKGWSMAHYVAGQYVEKNLGAKMVYIDKVNTADRPGTKPEQLAEQLVAQGAKIVMFTSDDMKDGAVEFAKKNPKVPVIFASGDTSWKDGKAFANLPNIVNVMGRMEYGKMIAGCTAALTTQTGKIGYLGPLINEETRRLAASAFLGAKYCWTNIAKKDPKALQFKVTWIGFWFNIPGVTSDPTQVANDFYKTGFDVVISGIDTTEALTEAKKNTAAGKKVWAVPYDYEKVCDEAQDVCLGVPYFNWAPFYMKYVKDVRDGSFKQSFDWLGPDWKDINNVQTSYVGFVKGKALTADNATKLDGFIKELSGGLNLWKGPLNLQDGKPYLKEGEAATDVQIWYLPQLLEGMQGQSVQK